MNRSDFLRLSLCVLFVLLSLPSWAATEETCTLQSFDCVLNVLKAERHWISPLAKSPAEPETWFKPERLVTHLTVEISFFKLRAIVPEEPVFPAFDKYLKHNAKQLLIKVGVPDGRTLTPYVACNGSLAGPLKIKGFLTLSRHSDIPGIDPNEICVSVYGIEILAGTKVKAAK